MNKLLLVFLLMLLSISYVIARDEFHTVSKDSVKMNNAFIEAKKTLDYFLKVSKERPRKYNAYGAYLKFEDNGETEYLWAVDIKPYNEHFYMGVIVSKPRLVKNTAEGKTVGFKKSDIFDWQLKNSITNKIHGAYTICASLDLSKEEDKEYLSKSGFICDNL